MKILFWLLVALDTAVLLFMFVLGLAAAPSSRTSGWAVAGYMLVVPGIVLIASIVLFMRASSPLARGLGLLVAAAPLLIVVALEAISTTQLRMNSDAEGTLTFFRAGPMRDIATAITANDTATVSRLLPQVDVNARGFGNTTLLIHALRQLRKTPLEHGALRTLLAGGADPNLGTDELPLELALQTSASSGVEPVSLLLKAGAKPNTKNQWGTPLFFLGTGHSMKRDVIVALLDHGADIKALDKDGRSILFSAAQSQNWPVVMLLLERGADWTVGRAMDGQSFKDKMESDARVYGDSAGLAEVIAWLKAH